MTTIQFFAPEILLHIFELAHDPHTPSTMKSAALVCRTWRDPAQRTLFLNVVVPISIGGSGQSKREKRAVQRWDTYRATRLYTPRRVELLVTLPDSCAGIRAIPGRPIVILGWEARNSLSWITGVKDLSITGSEISVNLLSDPDLAADRYGGVLLEEVVLIPASILDLSIILTLPLRDDDDLGPAFATVQHLHQLTLVFPPSITRLSMNNVGNHYTNTSTLPLSQTPFNEIRRLFSHDRLPNLTRIDFPDCKRNDLEDEVSASDLLDECERRSIRIVCWEEFI
ncbi:hypothetical protein RQP46_008130 [Phenoliferia psychrophenolica]